MKKLLLIPALCVIATACNSNSSNRTTDTNGSDMSQSSDWNITNTIKKNLMSDNSLSSDARMISVSTNNGVVTMNGTVANNDELRKVIRMAQNVPGVVSIKNQLTASNPYES